jgi:hypothetical protein
MKKYIISLIIIILCQNMACGGYLSITNPDEPGEWKSVSKNVSEFWQSHPDLCQTLYKWVKEKSKGKGVPQNFQDLITPLQSEDGIAANFRYSNINTLQEINGTLDALKKHADAVEGYLDGKDQRLALSNGLILLKSLGALIQNL